jgi:hypothetical protein
MSITLVRVFDKLPAAEATRRELLRSGFEAFSVRLSARDDEAGRVQGNFILESKDEAPEKKRRPALRLFSSARNSNSEARQNRTREIIRRGNFLLTVDVNDDRQYHLATDIIDRFGGIDTERRANRPHGS